MGYNVLEITDDLSKEAPENFFKYIYLDDQVIHYRLQGASHGFCDITPNTKKIIKDFIELNQTYL